MIKDVKEAFGTATRETDGTLTLAVQVDGRETKQRVSSTELAEMNKQFNTVGGQQVNRDELAAEYSSEGVDRIMKATQQAIDAGMKLNR